MDLKEPAAGIDLCSALDMAASRRPHFRLVRPTNDYPRWVIAQFSAIGEGIWMITAFSLLGQVDSLCGTFATALHNSELQIYTTLGILVVLGVFLFPPKNDSDQA
jgi:hypothetical protein